MCHRGADAGVGAWCSEVAGVTDIFEDRYGAGARARLIALFRQPCVTFAAIADEFGVSRERVRQWHLEILPDAPRGRERRRRCGLAQHRRHLLTDPLFRAFYRHARPSFSGERLQLIPSGDGFRKRLAMLDAARVALKAARPGLDAARGEDARSYFMTGYRGSAAFVYCRLTEADFLFMPASALPATGTTFVDSARSKYHVFKNTFAALTDAAPAQSESARTDRHALRQWASTPVRSARSSG
jgi:hypothetical protein